MSISAAGKQTVLVVGGGEFIDTRLTQALSASALYHPILLRTHAELAAALPQAAMVVNCVAVRPRTIVAVTQALCEAARRNPPLRIVHLSSMAVYGAATGVVDEATEPREPLNDYARARIEAEIAGAEVCGGRRGCRYHPSHLHVRPGKRAVGEPNCAVVDVTTAG